MILTGRGLAAAQAGETAHFTVDAVQASPGRPEVVLTYPNGAPVAIELTQPRPNEAIWLATYTPSRSAAGPLNLIVKWNNRLVKGCPLTVQVGTSIDASKVLCSGEGLRQGVVGREIRSWIDTRRAGPGELTAHCTGPRKVAYCELYDHGDATFTLNVKPQEPGRHLLTIKYGGQHVNGSPFSLKVAGAPDASKVKPEPIKPMAFPVIMSFRNRFRCVCSGRASNMEFSPRSSLASFATLAEPALANSPSESEDRKEPSESKCNAKAKRTAQFSANMIQPNPETIASK